MYTFSILKNTVEEIFILVPKIQRCSETLVQILGTCTINVLHIWYIHVKILSYFEIVSHFWHIVMSRLCVSGRYFMPHFRIKIYKNPIMYVLVTVSTSDHTIFTRIDERNTLHFEIIWQKSSIPNWSWSTWIILSTW